jgi:hypothetical protein
MFDVISAVYKVNISHETWSQVKGEYGYRGTLMDLIVTEGGGRFAEVGVERGRTCRIILHHCGDIITEYWAIDPWTIVKSGKRQDWSQERWDKIYFHIFKLMKNYPQLRVLRTTSVKGAEIAQEEGLKFDIVFIDGDHSYEMVKADILCWKPLVRKGGLLTGHDYSGARCGVVRAVNEVLGGDNITLLPGNIWTYRI